MHRLALWTALLLSLAACMPQTRTRTLTASLPAAGITALSMNVNVGAITIRPGTDANVHIKVGLQPTNKSFWSLFTGNLPPKAMLAATIGDQVDNGNLKLAMNYPGNGGSNNVSEHWEVTLPAGVHIHSQMNIGKLDVSGMTGGVSGQLNIGEVTLDVPRGPLDVRVKIGKVAARVASTMYGKVYLASNVGDTKLEVNGLTVGDRQREGTGSQMHYQGKGTDAINLTVDTGTVSASLADQQQNAPAGK